jgi:hypothetical protein
VRLELSFVYRVLTVLMRRSMPVKSKGNSIELLAQNAVTGVVFPFYSRVKTIESSAIKTLIRGLAVCVNQPFSSRQSPHWPWLAVSATQIRQPITPLCAPSVVQLQVPLLPMQPVAAKPKARLLAHLQAAYRAALLACQPVTNTEHSTPLLGGMITYIRPFEGKPRVAFLHFRAVRALPRKGCYV